MRVILAEVSHGGKYQCSSVKFGGWADFSLFLLRLRNSLTQSN